MKRVPFVTDHAVLRYIERVHGIDLAFIRDEIARTVGPAIAVGAKSFAKGGFVYQFRDCVVTTVIEAESASQGRAGSHAQRGRSLKMKNGDRRRERPEIDMDEEAVD